MGINELKLYELLERITVTNGYLGTIDALTAWSTNATITANDMRKVRRTLGKYGYKCNIAGGIIYRIYKP